MAELDLFSPTPHPPQQRLQELRSLLDHHNRLEDEWIAAKCHIHTTTQRYIQAGFKPEGYASTTDRYRTLAGALHCLVNDCRISGLTTEPDQPTLFRES